MISSPSIPFADESTGALNKSNGTGVLNLLTELNRSGQIILTLTAMTGSRLLWQERYAEPI